MKKRKAEEEADQEKQASHEKQASQEKQHLPVDKEEPESMPPTRKRQKTCDSPVDTRTDIPLVDHKKKSRTSACLKWLFTQHELVDYGNTYPKEFESAMTRLRDLYFEMKFDTPNEQSLQKNLKKSYTTTPAELQRHCKAFVSAGIVKNAEALMKELFPQIQNKDTVTKFWNLLYSPVSNE
jgi:hypothetical protein